MCLRSVVPDEGPDGGPIAVVVHRWHSGISYAGGRGVHDSDAGIEVYRQRPISRISQILLRNARLIRSNLAAQIDRLDRVEMELTVLSSWAAGEDHLGAWIAEKPGSMIHHLAIQNNPNDSIDVEINLWLPFHLSPSLAGSFCSSRSPPRCLVEDLRFPLGIHETRLSAFSNNVCRGRFARIRRIKTIHSLRKVLSAAGYDPGLIQSHQEKGVRLAFRSKHLSKKAGNSKEESWIGRISSV